MINSLVQSVQRLIFSAKIYTLSRMGELSVKSNYRNYKGAMGGKHWHA